VIAEGGVTWLPALLWRLDQEWKGLRSEVPWVMKAPSEYVRDHVRFTTQPLERPEKDEDLIAVLDMMDAHNLLMFSSDYPESDFVSPEASLPRLPAEWDSKMLFENARQWYSL
ncbi:amidohydrolase, partial [Paenibacillus sepulcri]|nr:amidohydrolase [Paenibacillus sepulcri]